jgi:hypothetical protein
MFMPMNLFRSYLILFYSYYISVFGWSRFFKESGIYRNTHFEKLLLFKPAQYDFYFE